MQFVLAALGPSVPAELQSGAHGIIRDISSGSQNYETDSSLFPINKPVEKYEARLQCTGEAIYANDIPILPSELHAAFVYSTMANCELDAVDTSVAMVSLFDKYFWYLVHSSLVDYLAQVIKSKNYPTTFYCIFQLVWVPMTTTQNIRGCLSTSNKTLFS